MKQLIACLISTLQVMYGATQNNALIILTISPPTQVVMFNGKPVAGYPLRFDENTPHFVIVDVFARPGANEDRVGGSVQDRGAANKSIIALLGFFLTFQIKR